MQKKRVAVLFGGRSVEHEISVLSAMQAMDALDPLKYEVIPVYVAITGKWYTNEVFRKRDFYKKGSAGIDAALKTMEEVTLYPQPGKRALQRLKKPSFFAKGESEIPVDVFIPIFHGQFGEDGCFQALFEIAEVPYAGPTMLGTAIAMDKYVCKAYLSQHGIPVLPSVVVNKSEAIRDLNAAGKMVTSVPELSSFPLFVKPVNLGSSIGVSRAADNAALSAGLMKVFQFDLQAIVEPCVTKLMEINVSVIEREGEPEVSVVEIPVTKEEFLSYEDKYMRDGKGKKGSGGGQSQGMAGLTRVINPTDLDPQIRDRVRHYAAIAYKALNISGVVRFDFMVNLESGELYFNELNPIPGSLAFYLWEKSSPSLLFSDVLDRIIEGAERRYVEKRQLKREIGFKALV